MGQKRKERKKNVFRCISKEMGDKNTSLTPTQPTFNTTLAHHPTLLSPDPTQSGGACPPWDLLQVMILCHQGASSLDVPMCPPWDLPWVNITPTDVALATGVERHCSTDPVVGLTDDRVVRLYMGRGTLVPLSPP